jgi:intracellular septation protein
VAIAATFAQIGWLWFRGRKIDTMLWVSLVIITVFGGLTLYLHDENFIKWKPTVLYWAFATALLGGYPVPEEEPDAGPPRRQMELPEVAWTKLNWSWIAFFVFHGLSPTCSSRSTSRLTTGSTSSSSAASG